MCAIAESTTASPNATKVEGNRWQHIKVPDVDAWKPTELVSFVIPTYNDAAALSLTLEAVARQSYPRELLEVIIADDGSNPPPHIPEVLNGVAIRSVRQDHDGFGLARARNLGAQAALGSILIFLDSDMVPEPRHAEFHARWHHVVPDAVTIGFRKHVDFKGVSVESLRNEIKQGTLNHLFAGRPQNVPEYVEFHMQRTNDLASDHQDLYRIACGGNLGMRAEIFNELHGFDGSFKQWGAEDIEFGYRAFINGCLLIPERHALCWHQGLDPGYVDPDKSKSLEEQRARLAHLIANPGFRRSTGGRSFERPRLVIEIEVQDYPKETVTACVESILSGSLHDLAVVLKLPGSHPDAPLIAREFESDPRVDISPAAMDLHPNSPFYASFPAAIAFGTDTAADLLRRLEDVEKPRGLLHVVLPGIPPKNRLGSAWSRRAWARSRRRSGGGSVEALMGEMFGEEWISGREADLLNIGHQYVGTPPTPQTVADPRGTSGPDLVDIQRFVVGLPPEQRRILFGLAKKTLETHSALTRLRKARTRRELKWSLRAILAACLPIRFVEWVRARMHAR